MFRPLCLLTLLLLATLLHAHEAIVLHYALRPPYTLASTDPHSLDGVAGKRIVDILRRAGIPYHLNKTPPLRQLDAVRDNKSRDCTYDWYKTPEREIYARFSEPFAQDSRYVYVTRKNSVVNAPVSMSQIINSGLTMVRVSGYSYGADLDAVIKSGQIKTLITHGEEIELMTTIMRKRSDFGLLLADEVSYILRHNELLRAELRVYETSEMPEPEYTYFLCSHKVDNDTMSAFNQALLELPFTRYQ